MKQRLIRRIKKFAENIESKLVDTILLALFGGTAGLLVFSKKFLNFFLHSANIPTPLWVSTLLALVCCLYIYIKFRIVPTRPLSQPTEYEFIKTGKCKWKVIIMPFDQFQVDAMPYCAVHDKQLIDDGSIYCPDRTDGVCEMRMEHSVYSTLYKVANSEAEHIIRNKKKTL